MLPKVNVPGCYSETLLKTQIVHHRDVSFTIVDGSSRYIHSSQCYHTLNLMDAPSAHTQLSHF